MPKPAPALSDAGESDSLERGIRVLEKDLQILERIAGQYAADSKEYAALTADNHSRRRNSLAKVDQRQRPFARPRSRVRVPNRISRVSMS
jgi:hypothetical protein